MRQSDFYSIKSGVYNVIASHICPIWGQDTCQCGADCGNCEWLDKFIKNALVAELEQQRSSKA